MSQDTSNPIRAPNQNDFELWIRMATDNKINTTNSWNFALIDYFHDLRLLRQGDSINFQKATSTLDGCVKIYASRIDSAATETGKLLSGLSSKHSQDPQNDNYSEDDESDEEAEADEDSNKKKKTPARLRTVKTLVKKFNTIKLKQMEKELYVDPIFKKALSDFDEGGSKSLLLNMLKMSPEGRVVFNATENSGDVIIKNESEEEESQRQEKNIDQLINTVMHDLDDELDTDRMDENESSKQQEEPVVGKSTINIKKLSCFVMDSLTETNKVCPSIKQLELIAEGEHAAADLIGEIEQIDYDQIQPHFHNNDNFDHQGSANDYDDYGYDGAETDYDAPDGVSVTRPPSSLNDTRNRTQYSLFLDGDDSGPNLTMVRLFDENYHKNLEAEADEEGGIPVADFLDKISARNWRGPEHWKVVKMKQFYNSSKTDEDNAKTDSPYGENGDSNKRKGVDFNADNVDDVLFKKRRKKDFRVDFMDDEQDLLEDELFNAPKNVSRLLLAEKDRGISETANCLPDDLEFTAKRFIYLNLKPDQRINTVLVKRKRNLGYRDYHAPTAGSRREADVVADEHFFAENYNKNGQLAPGQEYDFDQPDGFGNDSNGMQDDNYDGPIYDEMPDMPINSQFTPSQLARSNNGINYARTSKKVNVRLLKQNLWESLEETVELHKNKKSDLPEEDKENDDPLNDGKTSTPVPTSISSDHEKLKFTELVSNLAHKYSGNEKAELSTSFCFICLLHLANENGFTIDSNTDNSDLFINRA